VNRAEKISAAAVMLLITLAGLLLLIQHVNIMKLRASPAAREAAAQEQSEYLRRRGASGADSTGFHVFGGPADLIVPVRGVRVQSLVDTWGAARAQGRTHQGNDIMAPAGTPVLAARDGRIVRFFDSERGGITIYQFDLAENYVFYYAHLSSRASGVAEGAEVRQGQVIGYVGSTGNATTPHLHFEIQRLGPDKKWYHAEAVNPYPYLLNGEAPQ
jgi:murein DD-endopeptidase MepM/ murein hydrolase activator NlpD